MKKKDFILNLSAQLAVLLSNLIINFILTPYVVNKLGEAAYGFIGLINNFVSYITVVTVALNTLAGRYITLSYHKKDIKRSEEYFASVFYANIFLSFIVILSSVVLIFNATNWLKVPNGLEKDVQLTIFLSSINTIISLITVVFGIAAFIKNKLYLNSISQMLGALGRVIVIVIAFFLFRAHIWYYALAAIVSSVIILFIQRRITRKECPDLKVNKKNFSVSRIIEIAKNGIWISVESLNKILQTGLDLLIANIFINPYASGILSIAKTVPNVLVQLTTTIASVFSPNLAKLYATDKKKELISEFKYTTKVLSVLMIVPLIGFMTFGEKFYFLWLHDRSAEDIKLIQILSFLTVFPLLVNAYVEGLYYANTLTNRIKGSVLLTLGFSLASIITEIILLYTTKFEPLYIIAGTSSVYMSLRYFIVTPLYCAHILNVPYSTFYPSLFKSLFTSLLIYALFYFVNSRTSANNWFSFIAICGVCALVGYIIVVVVLLNKEERSKLKQVVQTKIKRK